MQTNRTILLCIVLLAVGGLLSLCSATKHYVFILEEVNVTRLCTTKSILTVNGSFPGPEIHVHKNETAFVTVHNQGGYGVTIHWHGVKQPGNPWSDGPENITQCRIPSGGNFTYEVIFSTEVGTLWWHAHSDWTRATVHGAIIISPAVNTSYKFRKPSKEQVIILGSWFNGDVMAIIDEALQTGGEPNSSDALTINGQPGDLYNCSSDSTFRLVVEYGKTYLLRIINAVMNEEMFFAVANHNITVVGVDAAYTKPIHTSYIVIVPGNTVDVLLTANVSGGGRHYIAARAYASGIAPFDNSTTTAILQYSNASNSSTPSFPVLPLWNDTDAVTQFTGRIRAITTPRQLIVQRSKMDRRILIAIAINTFPCANSSCDGPNGNRLAASLNNQSFQFPKLDILRAYYYSNSSGVYHATFPNIPPVFYNFTSDDPGNDTIVPTAATKVKKIKFNETVELVFQGTNVSGSSMNHPMHLHGFSIYLVGFGFGNFDADVDPASFNLVDPPELNTVAVPRNGWLAVRFVADNPGVWFMHCHLDRHSSWGMDTAFIVANGKTPETSIRPPPANLPSC